MNVSKAERKLRIRRRIRKVSVGTPERPRMSVFRSNKEIYVQLIDDSVGNTLVSASSRDKEISSQKGTKTEIAKFVGKLLAEKAIKIGVDKVSFDRGGNLYHGIVKALAESARESGLKF